jgi:hypothetical protein
MLISGLPQPPPLVRSHIEVAIPTTTTTSTSTTPTTTPTTTRLSPQRPSPGSLLRQYDHDHPTSPRILLLTNSKTNSTSTSSSDRFNLNITIYILSFLTFLSLIWDDESNSLVSWLSSGFILLLPGNIQLHSILSTASTPTTIFAIMGAVSVFLITLLIFSLLLSLLFPSTSLLKFSGKQQQHNYQLPLTTVAVTSQASYYCPPSPMRRWYTTILKKNPQKTVVDNAISKDDDDLHLQL